MLFSMDMAVDLSNDLINQFFDSSIGAESGPCTWKVEEQFAAQKGQLEENVEESKTEFYAALVGAVIGECTSLSNSHYWAAFIWQLLQRLQG